MLDRDRPRHCRAARVARMERVRDRAQRRVDCGPRLARMQNARARRMRRSLDARGRANRRHVGDQEMNVGPRVSLDDAWKKITLKYSELKKLSPGVLGCRFLYSPRSTFTTNNGLLIAGMNPGREADMDDRAYPRKDCNAYLWEEWTRSGGYQDRVRNFVERLARALGQSDWQEFFNNTVTSNFLPFRSESYPALGSALRPAKAFAHELWL